MDSLALGTPLVAVAGALYAHRVSSSILAAAGAFAARQRDATAPTDPAARVGLDFLVARNADDLYARHAAPRSHVLMRSRRRSALASRLLRNLPLLRLLKLQLLARHSGTAAADISRLCSSQRVTPCLRLAAAAPLFHLRAAVRRMERALQLMLQAHAHAPAGMHVLVAQR
jgi:hypothetical protein